MITRFTERYLQYQDHIDRIIQGLSDLHSSSCRPMVQISPNGEITPTGIEKWISANAEESFNLMQRQLLALLREQATIVERLKENTQ